MDEEKPGSAEGRAARLLDSIAGGDPQAASALLPLVYDELRALARSRMARERPDLEIYAFQTDIGVVRVYAEDAL